MTNSSKFRYPKAPDNFSEQARGQWNALIRALEQRDRDILFGDSKTIQVEQLKDGIVGKGFTTVAASPYYMGQSSGTLLVDSSVSAIDVYLTSAKNSKYDVKIIKKTTGDANVILVRDPTSAAIDNSTVCTISVQNQTKVLTCDGKQWWVIGGI